MTLPPPWLTPILKDRYQLQRQLSKKPGRRTLLVLDCDTQQRVVLKVLTFSHDTVWEDVKLFRREAELLQTLSHASIPQYIDAFEFETATSKGYVIVQDYIEALSLAEHLEAGRCFNEATVRDIVAAVLEILSYLHQRQPPVIHRDIKPSNILLSDRSGNCSGQLYLVDFDSVQTLTHRGGQTITVVGTYGYMPPEQFGDVAYPASDLYSLGATAIALLTRTHPADLPKTGVKLQFEDQVSLSANFQAWLQWMIDPDVEMRPDSAEVALQSLNASVFPQRRLAKANLAKSPMTPTQLLIHAMGWSISWGTGLGVIYAAIKFVAIMEVSLSLLVDIGISGILLGGINGLLIGLLTRLFYFPLTELRTHRLMCTGASVYVGISMSLWVSLLLSVAQSSTAEYTPTMIIIGALMGIPSYRIISQWYDQPLKPLFQGDRGRYISRQSGID